MQILDYYEISTLSKIIKNRTIAKIKPDILISVVIAIHRRPLPFFGWSVIEVDSIVRISMPEFIRRNFSKEKVDLTYLAVQCTSSVECAERSAEFAARPFDSESFHFHRRKLVDQIDIDLAANKNDEKR